MTITIKIAIAKCGYIFVKEVFNVPYVYICHVILYYEGSKQKEK